MSEASLNVDPLIEAPEGFYDHQTSKFKRGTEDSKQLMEELNSSWRYDARIASVSDTYSDEYTVDIYENGILNSDGTLATPTRQALIAHSVYVQEYFQVGCVVKVKILRDNTCIILPPEMPTGTGFGKVAMIIDGLNPGSIVMEYPRFALR